MQRFYLLHITLLGLWGEAKPSILSWNLVTVVTANSILSIAQSAGSACASEVEAVPSGAIVGPNRHQGKGEKYWSIQSCSSKGRIPVRNESGKESTSV